MMLLHFMIAICHILLKSIVRKMFRNWITQCYRNTYHIILSFLPVLVSIFHTWIWMKSHLFHICCYCTPSYQSVDDKYDSFTRSTKRWEQHLSYVLAISIHMHWSIDSTSLVAIEMGMIYAELNHFDCKSRLCYVNTFLFIVWHRLTVTCPFCWLIF